MQLQLTRWRNVFVLRRVGFLLAAGCTGRTLVQEHFTCIYEPSTTATRVNIAFSEGNAHATLSKPVDTVTIFVFSRFSRLLGQTVPVLQKSQELCWLGELRCVRKGLAEQLWRSWRPKASQRPRPPGSWSPAPREKKTVDLCGGQGRRENAGLTGVSSWG